MHRSAPTDGKLAFLLWSAALSVTGFLLVMKTAWPGFLLGDSSWQMQQARNFEFHDWHPPFLTWLWSMVYQVWPGPAPAFLLQVLLFTGGLFLFSLIVLGIFPPLAPLVVMAGWVPFLTNYLTLVSKDIFVAGGWLVSLALIHMHRERQIRLLWPDWLAVLLLFLIALYARYNSLVAALPLLVFLAAPLVRNRLLLWSGAAGVLVAAFFLHSVFIHDYLRADRGRPVNQLFVFDLGGISHDSGKNVFPAAFPPENERKLYGSDCYMPHDWAPYTWTSCSFVYNTLANELKIWYTDRPDLRNAWLDAIRTWPGIWLRHRLRHFFGPFLWRQTDSLLYGPWDDGFNDWGTENHFYRLYRKLILGTGHLPFYRLWFWLSLAAGLFVAAGHLRRAGERALVRTLSLSGILLVLPYLAIGISAELRYGYWLVAADWVALCLLLACAARAWSQQSRNSASTSGRKLSERPAKPGQPFPANSPNSLASSRQTGGLPV